MKRLFTLLVAVAVVAVVAPTEASAQFDLSRAINYLFGGSNEEEDDDTTQSTTQSTTTTVSPFERIAREAPALSSALGTWVYDTTSLEYLGTNSFANVALTSLESYGLAELEGAGITSGSSTLTLRRNGVGIVAHGEYLFEGGYSYDSERGRLTITAQVDGHALSCGGYMTLVDGTLKVMVNAKEALDAYLEVYPEQSTDSFFAMAQGVLASFDQVYVTLHFRQ